MQNEIPSISAEARMLFRRNAPRVEQMKIIIVGAGEVGFHIARRLAEERKQVVVIDLNIEKLRRIEDDMDVQIVQGSGSNPAVLKEAGAEDANIFLAVTDSDETNIVACLFASAIAPKATKLARIRSEEYTRYADFLNESSLNISMLVNPEEEIVRSIERLLTLPGAVEYGQFADGRIRVVGMRVEDGPLVGQPLLRFREIVRDDGIMVGAIARGERLIVPSGSDCIEKDDIAYFVYPPKSQHGLLAAVNRSREELKSACIVGGGNIGLRLARLFKNKGVVTKLIERDESRCEALADLLDGALVLHGDGTDKSLLLEENISSLGAFIAVTGDEESNILSCLLAKSLGVRETVARVNKAAYLPLVEAIGIEHSVSPRQSAVNSILHYIRQGKVLSSLSVGGDAAEVLEALLPEDSALVGRQVRGLNLPKGVLLLTVLRNQEAFIPSGQTVLAAQDRIVILSLRDMMPDVERFLATKKASASRGSKETACV